MKNAFTNILTPVLLGALCLSLVPAQAAPAQSKNDILHFSVTAGMENLAVATLPNATGKIAVQHKAQGKVTVQSFDIFVQGLAANHQYVILALFLDGSTSPVGTINVDAQGKGSLRFRRVSHGNGKINHLGRGMTALPEELSDLPTLKALNIAEDNGAAVDPRYVKVLEADLAKANKFQYLIKRDLSNEGMRAALQIVAQQNRAQLRLSVRGLEPNAKYWLAINSYSVPAFTVTEETSDGKGRLELRLDLEPASSALNMHEIQLWATATPPVAPEAPVLSTVLPLAP